MNFRLYPMFTKVNSKSSGESAQCILAFVYTCISIKSCCVQLLIIVVVHVQMSLITANADVSKVDEGWYWPYLLLKTL